MSPDHDVIVGVSGGVDSAVALKLVQDSGCRVSALFMKNWEEDDDGEYCAAAQDLEDARRVCAHLGVELKTVNLAAEYWDRVFTGFLESYRDGKTPNPDVLCNREIKFRSFMEFAGDYGADIMATGHYARLRLDGGRHRLLKGADPDKDQSYFLCLLDQSQLARAVFPLGELYKTSVRHLARRHALHNHARRDSTGICFIGERPFRQFLSRYLPPDPGSIESDAGRCLGQHEGLMYYTIGQRQGLGIGGEPGGSGQPWYVASKDFDTNTLVVVQGRDHPLLFAGALTAIDAHWIAGEPPAMPLRCRAKIRYRQPDQPCSVESGADGRLLVRFDTPQWAVTPGQMVVFYQDEECLGGASILGPGG
ncbi:MAG: tRNA 2-thiouridine(34) synthase MnmA [Gammaproteobacteria bacterium]|nr:tRNA 2-thiouridine(34) synthase MnmA [Gammaproteobacteria bacterium]